ncbi:MAG: DUF3198 domain-containing protein, partial [Candidatus Thermoplasmatota archaeon]|nr:DUF3198 domain-containing protein [Candidatus Thermoplasmatota archaeon]
MSGEQQLTITARLRILYRTIRFPLGVVILVLGAFLSISAFAAYSPLLYDQPFSSYVPTLLGPDCPANASCPANYQSTTTDWILLFVVAGLIIDIVGIYMVAVYLVARKRFEHLIKTKSKAEFVRNLPEVEDL